MQRVLAQDIVPQGGGLFCRSRPLGDLRQPGELLVSYVQSVGEFCTYGGKTCGP